MPTNLYGTNDNYHPENSHVLPALIRRFILAKKNNETSVIIWGTGNPRREFLHVDDLSEACFYLMRNYNESSLINIGSGQEVSIKELAYLIAEIIDYEGEIKFDHTKPDGTPRKLLDSKKINQIGWSAKLNLREGIVKTIDEVFDTII
jgi:GDP-L-fucose synthase